MGRCVNENCKKDPMDSMYAVCVNEDGDFACSDHCKKSMKNNEKIFLLISGMILGITIG